MDDILLVLSSDESNKDESSDDGLMMRLCPSPKNTGEKRNCTTDGCEENKINSNSAKRKVSKHGDGRLQGKAAGGSRQIWPTGITARKELLSLQKQRCFVYEELQQSRSKSTVKQSSLQKAQICRSNSAQVRRTEHQKQTAEEVDSLDEFEHPQSSMSDSSSDEDLLSFVTLRESIEFKCRSKKRSASKKRLELKQRSGLNQTMKQNSASKPTAKKALRLRCKTKEKAKRSTRKTSSSAQNVKRKNSPRFDGNISKIIKYSTSLSEDDTVSESLFSDSDDNQDDIQQSRDSDEASTSEPKLLDTSGGGDVVSDITGISCLLSSDGNSDSDISLNLNKEVSGRRHEPLVGHSSAFVKSLTVSPACHVDKSPSGSPHGKNDFSETNGGEAIISGQRDTNRVLIGPGVEPDRDLGDGSLRHDAGTNMPFPARKTSKRIGRDVTDYVHSSSLDLWLKNRRSQVELRANEESLDLSVASTSTPIQPEAQDEGKTAARSKGGQLVQTALEEGINQKDVLETNLTSADEGSTEKANVDDVAEIEHIKVETSVDECTHSQPDIIIIVDSDEEDV